MTLTNLIAKYMIKNKIGIPLAALALVLSAGGGMVAAAHADTATTGTTAAPATVAVSAEAVPVTTPAAGATPDATATARPHGHAPLGGDGIVASVSGSTIVMNEEVDEGGAVYTIDASSATVTKDGVTAALSSIAAGDKIFVKGTTTGTQIVATSIEDGRPSRSAL
jgi:hypothetical protein